MSGAGALAVRDRPAGPAQRSRVRSPSGLVDGSGKPIVYSQAAAVPAYWGAAGGRRYNSLFTSQSGPNADLFDDLPLLRDRSRALHRNNPYAWSGVEGWVANAVGTGIRPQSLAPEEWREEVDLAFEDWVDEADADGRTTFYGLQAIVCRELFLTGEALARFRSRRPEDGLSVPFQLQVVEGDHLPINLNTNLENGNVIRAGIEIDRIGRRRVYHLLREHPGDRMYARGADAGKTVPVPAEEVAHIYQCNRSGQLRGEPGLARTILRLHNLNEFDDASLERQVVASHIAGFVVGPDTDSVEGIFGEQEDLGSGVREVELEPGLMPYLPPGSDVKFASTPDIVPGEFRRDMLHGAAAGIGCPYELVTWDLRDVNYSSIRAGLIEFRRRVEMFVHGCLVFLFCRPVWARFMDDAVLSGRLPIRDYGARWREYHRVRWVPQGWRYVDPEKEVNATVKGIRAGIIARDDAVAELGEDAARVDRLNARGFSRARGMGLAYESDPSNDGDKAATADAEPVERAENPEDASRRSRREAAKRRTGTAAKPRKKRARTRAA